jgi:hypothetical protein
MGGDEVIGGFLLLILGGFLAVFADRPKGFGNPLLALLGAILGVVLMTIGIGMILSSSRSVGIWTTGVAAVLWLFWRRHTRSMRIVKAMYSSYRSMRMRSPGVDEQEILRAVLKTRYPTWDDQRIRDYVEENRTIYALTTRVVGEETGEVFDLQQWPGGF